MFTILIPTWNNLAYLRLVVESIRTHSSAPHQIVVHVNDGSDGTLAWVREQGIEHTASTTTSASATR
jgi:glycosyltransferase involved in cell wall biosynthesis